ncbi:unnamed protein product [Ilex paraguariensis]|uniref:NB-ARC domain-containing protein n=1 Tax=Ilex paraguariensis TaxID=185542 RepID=A0ABC8TZM2_9AQUA
MTQRTLEQPEKRVVELLRDNNVSTIVLAGKPGIGKTWMARKVSTHSLRKHLFGITLWAYLNRKYDERTLCESIACQLSLLTTSKEWQSNDNEEVEEEEENLDVLKRNISATLAEKSLLLVLDDEGSKMSEHEITALLPFPQLKSCKKLITSINKDGRHKSMDGKEVVEVLPLSIEKSLSVLKQIAGAKVFESPGVERLAEDFIKRNMGLTPISVVMLAKALCYRGHGSDVRVLERALEESSGDGNYSFMQLLCSGYDEVPDGVLIDCTWQGIHFFRDRGCIHFSELIAYWIMEGYLGDIDSMEKAYEEGHRVLMELMDCQMLKKVEGDYIIMERTVMDLDELNRCGFGRTASLGLAIVFEDGKWDGIGRIMQGDGIMKAHHKGKNTKKFSTLLLDGNCLSKEIRNNFFEPYLDLQFLALFNLRLESLSSSLSIMNGLNVLVIRGCTLLVDIGSIRELKNLSVLEISGARSLKSMPDEFFTQMTQLRSLNLSALQIEVLPPSFYDLTELQWLILKDCSCLKRMQSLKRFEKLVVLNLSGVTSLDNFPEKTFRPYQKLQTLDLSTTRMKTVPLFGDIGALTHLSLSDCRHVDRLPSIKSLAHLQVLDLSGTSIKEFHDQSLEANFGLKILDLSRTPVSSLPSNISNPCQLYLKGCLHLQDLPCIESLKDLETLDLSGASSLEKIDEKFFKDLRSLRILNLSETKVNGLPPLFTLCNLRQLLLSCCECLVKLPALNSLSKLEVLDLSGCNTLTVIEDESFEQMSCLQRLILSGTKIERLPFLSNVSSLRYLSLRKCINLEMEVEALKSLSNLEELNLCGINCLTRADFLEHMSHLRVLDLSETQIEQLPSISHLKNLVDLSLRGCQRLETVPNLEKLTTLEILDLSGTVVRHLPSLTNFSNLRQLLLRNCLSLEEFQNIEMLDPSEAIHRELPYGISKLTQVEHLDLPNISRRRAGCGKIQCLPEEQWDICTLPVSVSDGNGPFVSCSVFSQPLEKDPLLWETSFKQFQFSVRPIEKEDEIGGTYIYKDELIYRDIYFKARHFSYLKEHTWLLEINGFHYYPRGIEDALSHAEYVFLFDNSFVKCLSNLGADNIKMMRGCWIKRCTNMENVFNVDKVEDTATMEKTLELLWISYAIRLERIYGGDLKYEGFRNLKCLYLDCCPKLPSVFLSSHQPQNLEILHIKFCDEMRTLLEHTTNKSALPKLPKLRILHLWELPKFRSIGCVLPSLLSLQVGECPMFEDDLFCHICQQIFRSSKLISVMPCQQDSIVTLCPRLQTSSNDGKLSMPQE